MSLTNEEWDLVIKTATDFKSNRWGYKDPETGEQHL